MKPFMDADFLLENDVAKKLYHEHAEKMPKAALSAEPKPLPPRSPADSVTESLHIHPPERRPLMKNVAIRGIIPPILTPMNEDESINVAELRNQVNRMIEAGCHALFPFGTNGEGYILSGEEKKLVLETVVE